MIAQMKTGSKIMAGFALALLITVVVGAAGLVSANRVNARLEEIVNAKFPSAQRLAEITEAQTRVARHLNALILPRMTDQELRRGIYADMERLQKEIGGAMQAYEALPHGEEAARLWSKVIGPHRDWDGSIRAAVALVREHDRLLARSAGAAEVASSDARVWSAYLAARKEFLPLNEAIQAVLEQNRKEVDASKKAAGDASSGAIALVTTAILIGAATMVVLGVALSRSVGKAIRALLTEAGKLATAVEKGRLEVRGERTAVSPEFQPVVEGMNKTMDAYAKPIEVTAEYVERISLGDLPAPITEPYEGDFDAIKTSFNHLIEVVHMRNADIRTLVDSALAGRLDQRADTAKYKGANGKLLEGINRMLDAMLAPIQEASQVLQRLAHHDLRARMTGSYQGDHAQIKEALNATAQSLHDALAQVAHVVEQVASSAHEIAGSAQAVASGASEQASSLEETSAALESMSSMTKQSTDNAQHANALAQQARAAAAEGGAATEQMTSAMLRIRSSAEGTSQIIKDINEIAFQTNLLALNAAVEAARAGEAGRGFAVVAEEVRSLALRSKEAATKTEELIRQSVKEAGEGEVTAKHVNEQLTAIVGSIGKVSEIVAEIAASAKEQAAGIEQVNHAVSQMDKVTQQNAASAAQSSSAASDMSGEARELSEMVGAFLLERASAGPNRPAKAPGAAAPRRPAAAKRGGSTGSNGIALSPSDVIPLGDEHVPGEF